MREPAGGEVKPEVRNRSLAPWTSLCLRFPDDFQRVEYYVLPIVPVRGLSGIPQYYGRAKGVELSTDGPGRWSRRGANARSILRQHLRRRERSSDRDGVGTQGGDAAARESASVADGEIGRSDDGRIDLPAEMAVRKLDETNDVETATGLLLCVVRCQTLLDYPDDRIPWQTHLEHLAEDSPVRQGAREWVALHQLQESQPERFRRWGEQVDRSGRKSAPRHGWPRDRFAQLVRALGKRQDQRGDRRRAEAYYRLDLDLTPSYCDPEALLRRADLWMSQDKGRDELLPFLAKQESRFFQDKGEAIQGGNYRRAYETHHLQGVVYSHLGQWKRDVPFHNAESQMYMALHDARRANGEARARGSREFIADWRLVETLSTQYESTGRHSDAFNVRLANVQSFQEFGKFAEASAVLRKMGDAPVPSEVRRGVRQQFEQLRATLKKDGPSGLRNPADDGSHAPVKLPGGKQVLVIMQDRGGMSADELRKLEVSIGSVLELDAASRSSPPVKAPERGASSANRVRRLPVEGGDDVVEGVRFDGIKRQGAVDVRREGKAERICVQVLTPADAPDSLPSFRYVRP